MSKPPSDIPSRKPVTRQTSPHNDEQPPAYTPGPSTSQPTPPPTSLSPNPLPPSPNPRINFSAYNLPSSTLSKDSTSLTLHDAKLAASPIALTQLLTTQLPLPPIPLIRIHGIQPYSSSDRSLLPDFDLKIRMLPYIQRPDWPYTRCLSQGERGFRGSGTESTTPHISGGVEGWISAFCRDRALHKSFCVRRRVEGWDTEILEGRLRTLLAATGYQGNVTVSFPVMYERLVVHTPNPPGLLDHAVSFFSKGKKQEVSMYEGVEVCWPYSVGATEGLGADGKGEGKRVYAVMGEDEWWREWKATIWYAVCEGRKGWVTEEDRMDVALQPGKVDVKWKPR